MKNFTRIVLAAALVAFSAQTVEAQAGQYGATEDLKFLGTYGGSGSTGPYRAQWLTGPGQPQITIFCVDYFHGISTNNTWTVNVTSLAPPPNPDLSDTRLGFTGGDGYGPHPELNATPSPYQRYVASAYLASLMEQNWGNTSLWATYHKAIWELMSPGYPSGSPTYTYGDNTEVSSAMTMAGNIISNGGSLNGFNIAEWAVMTDENSHGALHGKQEYITRVSVPEPGTILLIATGMFMLIGVNRRRITEIVDAA